MLDLSYTHLKRLFDFLISFILLAFLSPFFLIIAILIKLDSKGPVFFVQERVGKNEKLFKIYKFRTMKLNAEPFGPSPKSAADPRLTRIGRFLREYSLDELPQLYNIIKAVEADEEGDNPEKYRDYLIKKPLYDSSPDISEASGILKDLIAKTYNESKVRIGHNVK